MTIQEARRLGVGDCVIYGDVLDGIVIQVKYEAVRIQWGTVPMDVPFEAEVLDRIQKKVKVSHAQRWNRTV